MNERSFALTESIDVFEKLYSDDNIAQSSTYEASNSLEPVPR